MEVSRILRVLITLLLVVTFIVSTVAAYRQNREINSMTNLSDATSSIVTKLATQELAWRDSEGNSHPYVVDEDKLSSLNSEQNLAGENFAYQTEIKIYQDNQEKTIGSKGPNPPEGRMTSAVSVAVTLLEGRKPAKLEVVAWYS